MTQVTREVFNQHLSTRKDHDEFVENGDTLMSKLEDLKISRARGSVHTFGFVIPSLDDSTSRAVLKLLTPRKWTALMNFHAKVKVGVHTYSYTHVVLTA